MRRLRPNVALNDHSGSGVQGHWGPTGYYTQRILDSRGLTLGTETLVSINPSVVDTTEAAMSAFDPKDRDCYSPDEFKLSKMPESDGFRSVLERFRGRLEKSSARCVTSPMITC